MLLDSHIAVWWLTGDARLSATASAAITRHRDALCVSAASVWELEIKRSIGKFEGVSLLDVLADAVPILDITAQDAHTAAHLPQHHGDPFDRMIVAQAIERGLAVVSADSALAAYDLRVIW